jgi:hypothetical protein
LALCAAAIAALAVGPFLYRSMLPAAAGEPAATCSFVAVTAGLFILLAAATVWLLWRRRQPGEPEFDRRLWEKALGRSDRQKPRPDDDR